MTHRSCNGAHTDDSSMLSDALGGSPVLAGTTSAAMELPTLQWSTHQHCNGDVAGGAQCCDEALGGVVSRYCDVLALCGSDRERRRPIATHKEMGCMLLCSITGKRLPTKNVVEGKLRLTARCEGSDV